jgi:tetratricopeptide (TPR) repeat protein
VILFPLALAAAFQTPAGPTSPDPMPPRRHVERPAAPARPQNAGESRLRQCAALVRSNPAEALDSANQWLAAQGGLPARQCLGLAYVALQRWAPAATVYEAAAREAAAAADPARADFWVQAGNAWLAAGEAPKALAAFDAALATPALSDQLRGEVHLDRARAQVAAGQAAPARQDIDRALQLVPADPFAWYLSAALARRENNLARAATDIARALELAPADPDTLLLAGTIAGLSGHMDEAERRYRAVVAAAPDSDAGREAAASLATMREVEVPAPATSPPAPPPH